MNNNTFSWFTRFAAFLFFLLVSTGCVNKTNKPVPWDYKDNDIIGLKSQPDKKILIDIYLDATSSMEGYANPKTHYADFLSDVDAIARNSFGTTNVDLYKFGSKIRPINRSEFLSASKFQTGFYKEKGIFEDTCIDNVVDSTNVSGLSIVITDLFQKSQDVTGIVSKIKSRCFDQGIDVGLLCINSQFRGTIYDGYDAPYQFSSKEEDETSYRPFYALVFGKHDNIDKLFKLLRSKPYMKGEHFLIISPFIVKSFDARLIPDMKNDFQFTSATDNSQKNDVYYRLKNKKNKNYITVPLVIKYLPKDYSAIFSHDLEIVAYRRKGVKDSILINNVKIDSLPVFHGDSIKTKLGITIPSEKDWYSYKIYLKIPEIGGLMPPLWVDSLSSVNPSQVHDANKTLNLKEFVEGLLQANLSHQQPSIAKIYFTFERKN